MANVLPFRRYRLRTPLWHPPQARAASARRATHPLRWVGLIAVLSVGVIGFTFTMLQIARSPWPVGVTIRHGLSSPNCTAARIMGLAPATRGGPGYYPEHDRDKDGIACEPWPP